MEKSSHLFISANFIDFIVSSGVLCEEAAFGLVARVRCAVVKKDITRRERRSSCLYAL